MSAALVELAKRVPARLEKWAHIFIAAEMVYGVDAYTLAAICDQESLGGESKYLSKKGPSGTGDGGHGRGLMQIDDRYHKPFIIARYPNGKSLWEDPVANIMYGAWLLRSNLDELGQDLHKAIAAYNCGARNVKEAVAELLEQKPNPPPDELFKAIQSRTYGGQYLSQVLNRRAGFFNDAAV